MSAWKRRELGWLRADGEVFLERGAPMSDTGKPCWLVWVRAAEGDIEVHGPGVATTTSGVNARLLGDLCGNRPEDVRQDGPWFIHAGDEGWLSDAKIAADVHLAHRDERARAASS